MIRNLGPVCMYECSTCEERYTGVEGEKKTKTWKHSHSKNHWRDNKGRPEWEEEFRSPGV